MSVHQDLYTNLYEKKRLITLLYGEWSMCNMHYANDDDFLSDFRVKDCFRI